MQANNFKTNILGNIRQKLSKTILFGYQEF